MNTIEEWRSVPFEPLLEVSSFGRVRSVPYETPMPNGGIKINQVTPTFGVTQTNSKNYSRKIIVFRRKSYRVATLVAAAFNGPKPDGYDVSHEDEDSFNNKPGNLAYRTRKHNLNMPKFIEYCKGRTGEDSPRIKGRA